MAKYSGNDLIVKFGGATFTANLIKSAELNETGDVYESSGAGDAAKTYLSGKTDATVRIDAWDDSAYATIRQDFRAGTSGTLEINPRGTGGGTAKISMSAIVTGEVLGVPHDGVAPLSVDLQVSGTITEGTN